MLDISNRLGFVITFIVLSAVICFGVYFTGNANGFWGFLGTIILAVVWFDNDIGGKSEDDD